MKIGLHSAILADYDFEKTVQTAAKYGYQSIEAACWPSNQDKRRYAGVSHINPDTLDEKEIERIHKICSDNKVDIAVLGYYPNALDHVKEKAYIYIEHIKKLITASKKLGINKLSTFIGKDKTKTVDENLVSFKKVWTPIIEFAKKNDVWVGIENCPMYFTNDEWPGGLNLASSPYIWDMMFKEIDSEFFGISYDPSHLYFQGMDYIKPIYDYKDKIKHVHIKDAIVYKEKLDYYGIFVPPLSYMSPKIPGHGGIDWGRFISALNDTGYKEHACIEIEDRAFEENEQDILNSIRISKKYIDQFI